MSGASIAHSPGIRPETAGAAIRDDERVRVPPAPGIRLRPPLANFVGRCIR